MLSSNFVIFKSTPRSPTLEQRGAITASHLFTLGIDILGVVDKSIHLILFYEPIQGLSRIRRSCMFLSTVDAYLRRSTFNIVCLSAQPFVGSVDEVSPPPVSFLPRLAQLSF